MAVDNEGIEESLAGVGRALSGKGESTCASTYVAPDGTTYRCAGIVCPMFPGSHKAWGVKVSWTDEEAS